MNIFERVVNRRILGPVYDNKKENWTILTNKEIYAVVKKHTVTETVRSNILRWFGHVHHRMEENVIHKRGLYMNLGTTRLRGRPRNRCKMKCGRMEEQLVEGWQEKVHNRGEWKKLLRRARNCRILHMPMEFMKN